MKARKNNTSRIPRTRRACTALPAERRFKSAFILIELNARIQSETKDFKFLMLAINIIMILQNL